MPKSKLFPGQLDQLTFTKEQLISLASAPRSQVLWGFNETEPLSVAEVAKLIGKSPQSVHFHVNELAKLGLLLPVETRKKRSREEKTYAHAALLLYAPSPPYEEGCVEAMNHGFAAQMRQAIREMALFNQTFEKDHSFQPFRAFRLANLVVSEEDAKAIRKLFYDSLERANQMGSGEGVRVTLTVLMLPAVGESVTRYRKATGKRF